MAYEQNRKLADSPKEAAENLGIGLTKLYQEIAAGRLKALKAGKRTLITSQAQSDWINNLPIIQEGV